MSNQAFVIKVEGESDADAGRLAEELKETLLDATDGISVEKRRENQQKQDFGSLLEIGLNASAVVVLARALGGWLKLRNSASISVQTKDGKVIAKNLTSKDAARLSELFLSELFLSGQGEKQKSK